MTLTRQEICASHEDHAGEVCAGCDEPIDEFGNTANDFRHCCFPNCGCDGARLCMAPGGASEFAGRANGEGMWNGGAKNLKFVGELITGLKDRK